MIVSIIDIYQDTATHDKLIFPSATPRILIYLHVTIPRSPLFYTMGAINKESIWRSDAQLAAKQPCVKDDATPTPRLSLSSTPSSSHRVEAFLAAIMDQFQIMCAGFGSRLDHLSDEMC